MEHLRNESQILKKFIRRVKYEHKSSLILRSLVYLNNKLKLYLKSNDKKDVVINACMNLYVVGTSNFEQGHNVGFSFIVLGLAARIHYLVKTRKVDEIENIFGDL